MTYAVKEIFYTLQGEGANVGRAAVFCRFAGCNLWSGREHDRADAICPFCDTDFVGIGPDGGRFRDAESLAEAVVSKWPSSSGTAPFVVCTGGEPLLQLDDSAIAAMHARGIIIAIETNATAHTYGDAPQTIHDRAAKLRRRAGVMADLEKFTGSDKGLYISCSQITIAEIGPQIFARLDPRQATV